MESSAQKSSRRWRMTRAEAAATVLIPGDEWHPLDGVPAPEYIPEHWDGPHVGLRLVEGFRTLAAMPNRSVGGTSGYWPEIAYEWRDLMAQEESDLQLKEDKANAHNRAKIRPSAQAISRMETAIIWPGRYLTELTLTRMVQRVALARSREVDMGYVAYKMQLDRKFLRARNRVGLDIIARGLRRDQVRVF
jgi:hypothetical protein